MSTKEKGDLLENITAELCDGISDAKVTKRTKIIGKITKSLREIDILIEGKYGVFDVKIAIESKNYSRKVGVEKVEGFKSKLGDVGINFGVMVCSKGFTKQAKKRAKFDSIQLYEAYDCRLGNANLFIPLRYIIPEIKKFSFNVRHRVAGPFSITQDTTRWRFHMEDKILNAKQLVEYAWNNKMISQSAGNHIANFNAITISDVQEPNKVQYFEVSININVIEKYYLKLFPASFLKNTETDNKNFSLDIDLYSKEEDMLKNGWKILLSLEELNKAAGIENQPTEVKNVLIRERNEYNS